MQVRLIFEPEDSVCSLAEFSKAISRCVLLSKWMHKGPKEQNKRLAELKADDEQLMRLVRDAARLADSLSSVQSQNLVGDS